MTIHKAAGQATQKAGLSQAATQSHKSIVNRRKELTDADSTGAAALDMEDFAARMERLSRLGEAMEDDIFTDFDSPAEPPAAAEEIAPALPETAETAEAEETSEPSDILDLPPAADAIEEEDLDLDAFDALGAQEEDDAAADDFGGAEFFPEEDVAMQDEIDPSQLDEAVAEDGAPTAGEEMAPAADEETALEPGDETSAAQDEAPVEDAPEDLEEETAQDEAPKNIDLDARALDEIFGDEETAETAEQATDDADALAEAPAPEREVAQQEDVAPATEPEDVPAEEPIAFETVDEELADRNAQISEGIVEAQAAAEIEEVESSIDDADPNWGLAEEDDLLGEPDPFEKEDDLSNEAPASHQEDDDFINQALEVEDEEPVDYGAKNVPSSLAEEDNAQNVQRETPDADEIDVAEERAPVSEEDDMVTNPLDAMLKARTSRRDEVDVEDETHEAPEQSGMSADAELEEDFDRTFDEGHDEAQEDLFDDEGDVPFETDGKRNVKRTAILGAGALAVVGIVAVGAMGMMGGGEPNGGTSIAPPSPITKKVVDATTDDPAAAQAAAETGTKLAQAEAPSTPSSAQGFAVATPGTPPGAQTLGGPTGDASAPAADTPASDAPAAGGDATDLASQIPLPDNTSFDPAQSGDMNDVIAGLQQAGSGDMSDVAGADTVGSDAALKKALVGYTTVEDFSLVKDQIAEMKSAIDKMNGALSDKDAKIADLSKAVSAAQTEASNAKKLAIAQNDLMVKVVRMGEKVETGEKLIVDLSKRVAKLEAVDPADKAEVKKQLDDVMQRLDGLSRDVSMVARVAINGSPDIQGAAAGAAGGSHADPTSVYSTEKPLPKPPVDHGKVPSDVKKGDFVKGYGTVLDILPTSGGARLVVMENGSVLVK